MSKFKNKDERDKTIRTTQRQVGELYSIVSNNNAQLDRISKAVARWKNDRAVTLLVQSLLTEIDRCPTLRKDGNVFFAEEGAEIDASAVNDIMARLRSTLDNMSSRHVPPIRG